MKDLAISDLVKETSGSAELSVDEGGVRCHWPSRKRSAYIPFSAIADVNVDGTLFGGSRLVLTGTHGGALRLDAENPGAVVIQRVLLVALEESRAASHHAIAHPSALAREGRTLTEWLADIARRVSGSYRDAALDHAAILATLSDVHADVEFRAAAAYALLVSDSDEDLATVMRVFITHALPPIVLAAAHLAPGGPVLVNAVLAEEIAPYLGEADAAAFAKMTAVSSPDREAVITTALDRAKEELADEMRKAPDAPGPRWRRVHGMTATPDTRWVGKTWAL